MIADGEPPNGEARDLIALAREIADRELAPRATEFETARRFPREVFTLLGGAGLMSLPFLQEYGGGGQPYVVYQQVLEQIASRWASIALGISMRRTV